jgi:hypothetical protein
MPTLLYHSFPRRHKNETEKGLEILESIIKSGLLLTPEVFGFKEELTEGKFGEEITFFQKRVCFTEIKEAELIEHSKKFGCFTLEWDLETLNKAYINPVYYLPTDKNEKVWGGASGAIIARLCEIQEVLTFIDDLKSQIALDPQNIKVSDVKNGLVHFNNSDKKTLSDLLKHLERNRQPIDQQLAALQTLCTMFYPIENSEKGEELGYYYQREWRIFDGAVLNGRSLTEELTQEEMEWLENFDKKFYSEIIRFHSGYYKRVLKCKYLRKIGNKPVIETVRRILVHKTIKESAINLLSKYEINVEIKEMEL